MCNRLKYVNRDHNHPIYGKTGICLVRSKEPGPRNILVRLDDGQLVVAPWGNWRRLLPAGEMQLSLFNGCFKENTSHHGGVVA